MYVELLCYNTQIRVGPVSQMDPPPDLAECDVVVGRIELGPTGGFAVREAQCDVMTLGGIRCGLRWYACRI